MRIGRNFTGSDADNKAAITANALEKRGFGQVKATGLTRLSWFVSATVPQGVSEDSAKKIADEISPDKIVGLWSIFD